MKKHVFRVLMVLSMGLFILLPSAMAGNFKILTENYAPFNYTEKGKLTGLSSEVMQEILKRVDHPDNIKVMPWSDAYNLITNTQGYVLFSMSRTDERENLFKWVGPIATDQWVFYAKKGSGLTIGSLDDARKVAKIGTCKDNASEQFLKKQGFTNIVSVADDSENAKKLSAGEIDLWIVGNLQGVYKAKTAGIDPSGLESIFEIKDSQLYIAFSKATDDSEIAKWQKALDTLKAEGLYKKILSKYM